MSAPELDIHYVAHLARLGLSPAEEEHLGPQLNQVLQYVEKLKEVDVTNVEPMAHATARSNVSRPDTITPSLPHDQALRNAPAAREGLFVVPKIVE